MNRFRKALQRIPAPGSLPGNIEWTGEDLEHLKTVVEALEMAAQQEEKKENQNEV